MLKLAPIVTAMLSSSCCIIQLVLNFFSISCAGFAIFTPYRTLLSSITIVLLSYNMYHNKTKTSAIVCILLMISPEIVAYINQHTKASSTTTAASLVYYRFQLSGLGCEACANRIKNTLNAIDWVEDVVVYFYNQTAIIQAIQLQDVNIKAIIESIDKKYTANFIDSWKI